MFTEKGREGREEACGVGSIDCRPAIFFFLSFSILFLFLPFSSRRRTPSPLHFIASKQTSLFSPFIYIYTWLNMSEPPRHDIDIDNDSNGYSVTGNGNSGHRPNTQRGSRRDRLMYEVQNAEDTARISLLHGGVVVSQKARSLWAHFRVPIHPSPRNSSGVHCHHHL